MTWGTFANSIKEAELVSGTPAQIIIALFKSAGYIRKEEGLNEGTVNKWIAGERKCKVSSYFPDGELVNPEGAYKFFRNRPGDKLEELQKILRQKKDSDSPIDCETKNMDRFCWSLVNQFIDILGFQRLDIPISAEPLNCESIGGNIKMGGGSDKNMSDIIGEIVTVNESKCSKNSSAEQISTTSFEKNMNQKISSDINAVSEIAFPKDCKVCYCCKNWKGDTRINHEKIDEKYGECIVYGKWVRATEGNHCDRFRGNESTAFLYQIKRKIRSYNGIFDDYESK